MNKPSNANYFKKRYNFKRNMNRIVAVLTNLQHLSFHKMWELWHFLKKKKKRKRKRRNQLWKGLPKRRLLIVVIESNFSDLSLVVIESKIIDVYTYY